MNKKFFTLLAASCAAMTVNAQTITYDANGKVLKPTTASEYTSAIKDVQDPRFPYTVMGNGDVAAAATVTPICKLEKVNKGAESRLFQLRVNGSKELLAMQWNDKARKYQLVLIDPTGNYFIEETLWQVSATMVNESKALRYDFVNVGAQLPLQLVAGKPAFVEGPSITWTWSEVADVTATANVGLTGELTAAINEQESICLEKEGTDGQLKVTKYDRADVANKPTGLKFDAIEALPVGLSAAQINAMMTGTKNGTKVQFSMNPEIAGSEYGNPLTDGKFQAFEVIAGDPANDVAKTYQAKASNVYGNNTDKGYVVLAKEGNVKNLLRVDTVYHNASLDGRYELRLTTNEIEAPREAYVIGKTIANDATTPVAGGYKAETLPNAAINAMFQQAQFRFNYYPSHQSVLIQAKQYLYLDKEAKQSWWKTMVAVNVYGYNDAAYGDNAHRKPYYPTDGTKAQLNKTTATTEADAIKELMTTTDTKALWFLSVDTDNTGTGKTESNSTQDLDDWNANLIRLTTLTTSPLHSEVTMGYDKRDAELGANGFKGIKTLIRIGNGFALAEAADIATGWYYIQSANTKTTDLRPSNYWWYHDLAATNYTSTRFDAAANKWVIADTEDGGYYAKGNVEIDEDVVEPNLVFSKAMLEAIPSAQWYFDGSAGAGYYTVKNRESGIAEKSHAYFWKTAEKGVYVCKLGTTEYDTIRVVAAKMNPLDGYMNISQEVASADTSVFKFNFVVANTSMAIGANEEGLLQLVAENPTEFKVERVKLSGYDKYMKKVVSYTDDLIYGYNPTKAKADSLQRALYRIYKENVSSNTTEQTGKKTREYIVLEGGQYKLKAVEVKVGEDGYVDEVPAEVKSFYIKNMTNNASEFVLVDPSTTLNAVGENGVRAFVNQITAELQPAGLLSQGASNVFDNSLFAFEKIAKYNYRNVVENNAPDTMIFHKASNPEIKLYESAVEGANVTLLNRDNYAQFKDINAAMFVDTAYMQNAGKPVFMIALRPQEVHETGSNIDEHNRLISTTADYLMVLSDSVKNTDNKAYTDRYNNDRLGFVNATHKVDGENTLTLNNEKNKVYDLAAQADKLCPATFAFRYADESRENFYIETAKEDGTVVWVKVINEVPVVVDEIAEAEMYNVAKTTEAPTANEGVEVAEVSVVAENGAVIVKGAAGKAVTVSNILGQTIANTVVSSDNATIAVPAGIAVVAVDGEEAVKVVVK